LKTLQHVVTLRYQESRLIALKEKLTVKIRSAQDGDYPDIMRLFDHNDFVVRHTPYTYWVLKQLGPASTLVGTIDDEVCGFLAGVDDFSQSNCSLLLQITVGINYRRSGLGTRLVAEFLDRARKNGHDSIVLTIGPANDVSQNFFLTFAERHNLAFVSLGTTGNLGGILEEENIWRLTIGENQTFNVE
jgi:N-acetylglutamate synthase-like GNAT family acetyltransferase